MKTAVEPISISFTQFIRYATKRPDLQYTVVKQIVRQHEEGYDVPPDMYKQFREAVAKMLRENLPKEYLDEIAAAQTDASRAKHYPILAAGIKKFVGLKKLSWFSPPQGCWDHAGLRIRVRPEIGVEMLGVRYVIKLWLNDDQAIDKRRAKLITHLMALALPPQSKASRLCVMDVRRGKLFEHEGVDEDQIKLLRWLAGNFVSLYESM